MGFPFAACESDQSARWVAVLARVVQALLLTSVVAQSWHHVGLCKHFQVLTRACHGG